MALVNAGGQKVPPLVSTAYAILGNAVSPTRNVREDFMKYFDMNISRIDGVAIMSDCDNGGGRAAGHYRDIQFSAQ